MIQTKQLRGPNGLIVTLDKKEVVSDDPGAGTPAFVTMSREGRLYGSSYWCAVGEGVLDGSGGDDVTLSKAQMKWLESIETEIDAFLYECGS